MDEAELMALPEITELIYTLEESLDDRFYGVYDESEPQEEFQIVVRVENYPWIAHILTGFMNEIIRSEARTLQAIDNGWIQFGDYSPRFRRINADYWFVMEYDNEHGWNYDYFEPRRRISHAYLMQILQRLRQQALEIRALTVVALNE